MSDTDETNITNQSGGVDVNAQRVDVEGDVVGRDKVLNAGRDIIVAGPGSVINMNAGERHAAHFPAADGDLPRPANGFNPFGSKGKITDPALYLVRQPLTQQVFDELRKGVSLSVVGDSQTGKSSLLLHILRVGPAELNRPTADFAYVDMELVRSEDDFFEMLCDNLGVPLGRGYKLARALRGRKIVLCLDEVEKMTWQGFTHDLRSELRGLADGADAPLMLVISSRTPLDRLFSDSAVETSPLGSLCTRIDMPPFSPIEAEALVDSLLRGAAHALPPIEIQAAWQQSNGHPARLQQALREAFARANLP
jgi:hypothetical protein